MAFENRKSNLLEMAQGLSIRIDCIHDKSEGFATDLILSSLEQAYSHGRADCLQESLYLKKPLLPHELKLITQFLDMCSEEFSRHGCNDMELPDTERTREMLVAMHKWNDKSLTDDSEEIKDVRKESPHTSDFFVMSYMAHRIREALAEEEG